MSDITPIRRWRNRIPEDHRTSLDTRLLWLWHQRFGTVQMVYKESEDILDKTAATLVLQAILGRDLAQPRILRTPRMVMMHWPL